MRCNEADSAEPQYGIDFQCSFPRKSEVLKNREGHNRIERTWLKDCSKFMSVSYSINAWSAVYVEANVICIRRQKLSSAVSTDLPCANFKNSRVTHRMA